jgi:CheY-like chemotaxis protein
MDQVVRTLKERFDAHKVLLIVIPKLVSKADIQEAHQLGADAFVKNPFRPKDLLNVYERTLINPFLKKRIAFSQTSRLSLTQ